MLKNKNYSYASDIWALGCTICEMITGKLPYEYNDSEILSKSAEELVAHLVQAKSTTTPIPRPCNLSPELLDFLEQCFALDAKTRPSATNLLGHSFMKKDFSFDSPVTNLLAGNNNLAVGFHCDSIPTEYYEGSSANELE